ncbi:MAG: cytochrome c peroxidase [Glaciecola sp.]|jgi:cytochrome c peroxidase
MLILRQSLFSIRQDGGADCSSYYFGDFCTDESFHVIGMVQLGRGKCDGDYGTGAFGRLR